MTDGVSWVILLICSSEREANCSSFVDLGAVRPRGVRVGEVGLPAHIVDVEVVDEAHADRVVDEATQDALTEYVRRPHAVGERVLRPTRVTVLNVLGPLQEVWIHPMSPSVSENLSSGNLHQSPPT